MSNDEIFAIINFINSLSFSEFELETDELKIRMKRDSESAGPSIISNQVIVPENELPPDPVANLPKISAPITGVFYGSPTPESQPFVVPGDVVQKGDTLCILEAMKMMNEVKSDRSGVIKEIIPQDGEPVNETETLFIFQGE